MVHSTPLGYIPRLKPNGVYKFYFTNPNAKFISETKLTFLIFKEIGVFGDVSSSMMIF